MLIMGEVVEEISSDANNNTGRCPSKEVAGDEQATNEARGDHICRRRELKEVDE